MERIHNHAISRWWWTLDRVNLALIMAVIAMGLLLVFAGSPAVAERVGLESFHFFKRQLFFVSFAVIVMVAVSGFSTRLVLLLATAGLLVSLCFMVAVLLVGDDVKGASRWVSLLGISVQPSEFMKPCFAVLAAWCFARKASNPHLPSWGMALALYLVVALLLVMQPDIGMFVTISAVWGVQFFLSGLAMHWVLVLLVFGVGAGIGSYFVFDHVQYRVNRFFSGEDGLHYQVQRSLQAFQEGGWTGVGPGAGEVKRVLPDAHTDFIFAVAGEEGGVLFCSILALFMAAIVFRGVFRALKQGELFILLASVGLLLQFGLQGCINMAVSLHLMPTKGMTLPFISYGGSSAVATALAMGMMLALTRRRYGQQLPTSMDGQPSWCLHQTPHGG